MLILVLQLGRMPQMIQVAVEAEIVVQPARANPIVYKSDANRVESSGETRYGTDGRRRYNLMIDSVHPEIGKLGRDQGARKILPQA